jgi:hypothetical protein
MTAKSLSELKIFTTQLSTVALLLQPEPNCFTSYNTPGSQPLLYANSTLK